MYILITIFDIIKLIFAYYAYLIISNIISFVFLCQNNKKPAVIGVFTILPLVYRIYMKLNFLHNLIHDYKTGRIAYIQHAIQIRRANKYGRCFLDNTGSFIPIHHNHPKYCTITDSFRLHTHRLHGYL